MRFRFYSKLTILFLALIVFATFVSFGAIKRTSFAHNSLTSSTSKVIFNGVNSNFTNQLWVTDGTVAGTKELTNITYYYNSLNPTNITALGNTAVFTGQNAKGVKGLWVTDGTLTGTKEITNIPNAASSGISPGDITAFGKQALFDGNDTSGNNEIWITDGTSTGTKEITNIPNAKYYELSFNDIAVIGKQAFFAGADANGNAGIWVTDGTSAGTHQVSVMTKSGLVYPAGNDIIAFGNKALFNGTANSLSSELWVTDGTTAGTQQLTTFEPFNIAAFGNSALFANENGALWITDGTPAGTRAVTNDSFDLAPVDITAFGNKALFAGTDANGKNSIWVTDGTDTGTQELTTVGTNYSSYTSDITAFGNSALFYGVDTNGNGELWTTDGTKGNTKELTNIANNFKNGLQPGDIIAFGNEVFFHGYDANGNDGLWKTNDTTAGTQELTNIVGSDTSGFYPSDMTPLPSPDNPPPIRHKAFFFVQGLTSYLDAKGDIPPTTFGESNGIAQSLKKNFPGSDFIMFSYSSSTSETAYTCSDTFSQHLSTFSSYLMGQVTTYLKTHANTDVYIVGHSQGGAIALGLLELMANGNQITTNGGAIKGVITLDSPLGGVPGSWHGVVDYIPYILKKYETYPECPKVITVVPSLIDLTNVFKIQNTPDYGGSDIILPSENTKIQGNDGVALNEASKGVSLLTIGNTVDYLYDPTKCIGWGTGHFQERFFSTQWVSTMPSSVHVYPRAFTQTISGTNSNPTCPNSDSVSENHSLVLTNPAVQTAILQFVRGEVPSLADPNFGDNP